MYDPEEVKKHCNVPGAVCGQSQALLSFVCPAQAWHRVLNTNIFRRG